MSEQRNTRGTMERRWLKQGHTIIGVDEVGRGCLAGPVFAACVQLNYLALAKLSKKDRDLLRDSKTLSAAQREKTVPMIAAISVGTSIAQADVEEIEKHGIVGATFLAMKRAMKPFLSTATLLLVDGKLKVPSITIQQETIVKGDNLCYAIAAASIIAKVARDKHMQEMSRDFPDYGFERHVGYGTREHLTAIESHGICPLHRRNFAPIANLLT